MSADANTAPLGVLEALAEAVTSALPEGANIYQDTIDAIKAKAAAKAGLYAKRAADPEWRAAFAAKETAMIEHHGGKEQFQKAREGGIAAASVIGTNTLEAFRTVLTEINAAMIKRLQKLAAEDETGEGVEDDAVAAFTSEAVATITGAAFIASEVLNMVEAARNPHKPGIMSAADALAHILTVHGVFVANSKTDPDAAERLAAAGGGALGTGAKAVNDLNMIVKAGNENKNTAH